MAFKALTSRAKLLSLDGRGLTLTSGTTKASLRGPGQSAAREANEVDFGGIPPPALSKVHADLTYTVRYTHSFNRDT